MRKKCRYCDLHSLSGFIGDGICKYHWAGHLQCMRGEVPAEYRQEFIDTLALQAKNKMSKLLVKGKNK